MAFNLAKESNKLLDAFPEDTYHIADSRGQKWSSFWLKKCLCEVPPAFVHWCRIHVCVIMVYHLLAVVSAVPERKGGVAWGPQSWTHETEIEMKEPVCVLFMLTLTVAAHNSSSFNYEYAYVHEQLWKQVMLVSLENIRQRCEWLSQLSKSRAACVRSGYEAAVSEGVSADKWWNRKAADITVASLISSFPHRQCWNGEVSHSDAQRLNHNLSF